MPNGGCGLNVHVYCIVEMVSHSFIQSVWSFHVVELLLLLAFFYLSFPIFVFSFRYSMDTNLFHSMFDFFPRFLFSCQTNYECVKLNRRFHKIFALQPFQNAFLAYSTFEDEYNKISFYLIICLPWVECMQQTLVQVSKQRVLIGLQSLTRANSVW